MKFAFTNLACPAWSVEQVAVAAKDLGYDGVELRLLDGNVINPVTDRDAVTKAVATIRATGVEVCAFDSSCTVNHADSDAREEQLTGLEHWIALAHDLGIPIVRIFGGQGDSADVPEQVDGWVTDALRHIALAAERARVIVVLETHDAFASARRVGRILDAVASPSVAALWDVESPYRCGETIDEALAALGTRIAHVHVKDGRHTARDDGEWQLVPIGEGEVPVREQLRALARHGYTGYISVEWEKKWHPELAEPEAALPHHIAWLRSAIGNHS